VTRDLVQGFIDGYISSGGDPTQISLVVTQYLQNHPVYPASGDSLNTVINDLSSYRVTPMAQLAPLAVPITLSAAPILKLNG
jgi:hypothetical protein